MKNLITAAAFLIFAQLAHAASGSALIETIPQAIQASMEARIKASAEQQAGFKIKDFKVNWNEVQNCLEVRNEMDDSKLMGTCSVGFGAFQVQGEALVIVRANGYSISVLYTNVE
jgi:hypothetical protein